MSNGVHLLSNGNPATNAQPEDYWLKYRTKDSGKFYYYHPATKKTVWKLPPGAAFRYPGAKNITGNFNKKKETKPETEASSPQKLPDAEIPGLVNGMSTLLHAYC